MAGPSTSADWCMLCLRMSTEQMQYEFYKINENTELFYKLQYCIPELQLFDAITGAAMCDMCRITLQSSYSFKKMCLQTQHVLRTQYYQKEVMQPEENTYLNENLQYNNVELAQCDKSEYVGDQNACIVDIRTEPLDDEDQFNGSLDDKTEMQDFLVDADKLLEQELIERCCTTIPFLSQHNFVPENLDCCVKLEVLDANLLQKYSEKRNKTAKTLKHPSKKSEALLPLDIAVDPLNLLQNSSKASSETITSTNLYSENSHALIDSNNVIDPFNLLQNNSKKINDKSETVIHCSKKSQMSIASDNVIDPLNMLQNNIKNPKETVKSVNRCSKKSRALVDLDNAIDPLNLLQNNSKVPDKALKIENQRSKRSEVAVNSENSKNLPKRSFRFTCKWCKKRFTGKDKLLMHHNFKHNKTDTDSMLSSDGKCKICEKSFKSEIQFRVHIFCKHKSWCEQNRKNRGKKDSLLPKADEKDSVLQTDERSIDQKSSDKKEQLAVHPIKQVIFSKQCGVCGIHFKTRRSLTRHMKHFHSLNQKKILTGKQTDKPSSNKQISHQEELKVNRFHILSEHNYFLHRPSKKLKKNLKKSTPPPNISRKKLSILTVTEDLFESWVKMYTSKNNENNAKPHKQRRFGRRNIKKSEDRVRNKDLAKSKNSSGIILEKIIKEACIKAETEDGKKLTPAMLKCCVSMNRLDDKAAEKYFEKFYGYEQWVLRKAALQDDQAPKDKDADMPILFPEAEVTPATPRKEKPILQAYTVPRFSSKSSDKNEKSCTNYKLASSSFSELFPKDVEKPNSSLLVNEFEMDVMKEFDNKKQLNKWYTKEVENEDTDLISNKINDIISFLDEDDTADGDLNETVDDTEICENTTCITQADSTVDTINSLKVHKHNLSSDDTLQTIKQESKYKYLQLKDLCVSKENVDSLENNSLSQITDKVSGIKRSEDTLLHVKDEKKSALKVIPPRCTINILSNTCIQKPCAVSKYISSSNDLHVGNKNGNHHYAEIIPISNTEMSNSSAIRHPNIKATGIRSANEQIPDLVNKRSFNEKVASFTHSTIPSSRSQHFKPKIQTHTCDDRKKNASKEVNFTITSEASSNEIHPNMRRKVKIINCTNQTKSKKPGSYTIIPIYTIDAVQKNPANKDTQAADQLEKKIEAPGRMMLLKEVPSNVSSTESVRNSKFSCKLCSLYFTDKIDMINHVVIRHNAEGEQVISILDIEPSNIIEAHDSLWKGRTLNYQCCACPQKFNFNHNLLVHLFCQHNIDLISNICVEYGYYNECIAYRCVFCRLICTQPDILKEHLLIQHHSAIIDDNELELGNLSSFVCVCLSEEYLDRTRHIETKESSKHFPITTKVRYSIDNSECKGQKLTESNHTPQKQKKTPFENTIQTVEYNSHNSALRGNTKPTDGVNALQKQKKTTTKNTVRTAEHNTLISTLKGTKEPTECIHIPEKEKKSTFQNTVTIAKDNTRYSVLFNTKEPTERPYIPKKKKKTTTKKELPTVEYNIHNSISWSIKELMESDYVPEKEKETTTKKALTTVEDNIHNSISWSINELMESDYVPEKEKETTTKKALTTVEDNIHSSISWSIKELMESDYVPEKENKEALTTVEDNTHNSISWSIKELMESDYVPEKEKETTTKEALTTVEDNTHNSISWSIKELMESDYVPEKEKETTTKNTTTKVEYVTHNSILCGIEELAESLYIPEKEEKTTPEKAVTTVESNSHNSDSSGITEQTESLYIPEKEKNTTVELNVHNLISLRIDKLTENQYTSEEDNKTLTKNTVTKIESGTHNLVSTCIKEVTETLNIHEDKSNRISEVVTRADNLKLELNRNKEATECLYISENEKKTATENTVTTLECNTHNTSEEEKKAITEHTITRVESNTHDSVSRGIDELTENQYPPEEEKAIMEHTITRVESSCSVLRGNEEVTENLCILEEENKSTTDTVTAVDTYNSELKANKEVTECHYIPEKEMKTTNKKSVTAAEYSTYNSQSKRNEDLTGSCYNPEKQEDTITANTVKSNECNTVSIANNVLKESHYIAQTQEETTTKNLVKTSKYNTRNSKSKNSKHLKNKKNEEDSVALEKVNIKLPCANEMPKLNTSKEQDVVDGIEYEQDSETFSENKNESEQFKIATELETSKPTEINELAHVVPEKPILQDPLHKKQLSKSDSQPQSDLIVNKKPVDTQSMIVNVTSVAVCPRKGTSCKLCKKKFPSKFHLEEHMRRHICQYCNLMFKNMTYIPKHQMLMHKEQLNMYKEIEESESIVL